MMMNTSQVPRTSSKILSNEHGESKPEKNPRLNYSVEPGKEALLFYHQERNQNLIALIPPAPFAATTLATTVHPPTGTEPNVFNLLKTSISRQANAMEKNNTAQENTLVLQTEKETKKKDHFSNFHPSAKQLILFASAPDAKDVPFEIEYTCEHFMNATAQGVSKQELNMQFKAMGLGDVAYATGLTLNIYSGKLLYAVHNNPSNFSCFSCHEGTNLDKEEKQTQQVILHLIETKGKGQSVEEKKPWTSSR
jgi:hypothetical protein